MALSACTSRESTTVAADPEATQSAAATTDDNAMTNAVPGTPVATGTASPATNDSKTLLLEGLGELTVGKPVPAGSTFAERGAQTSDGCRTVSSPDYPGVYAITDGRNGQVRRITVGQRSDVKLIEGIGIGSTEKDVLAAFPGFRATPHKYVEAPAKYLQQPGNDPRLRFEIGQDGKVSLIHVGLMPQLGYVEGCS